VFFKSIAERAIKEFRFWSLGRLAKKIESGVNQKDHEAMVAEAMLQHMTCLEDLYSLARKMKFLSGKHFLIMRYAESVRPQNISESASLIAMVKSNEEGGSQAQAAIVHTSRYFYVVNNGTSPADLCRMAYVISDPDEKGWICDTAWYEEIVFRGALKMKLDLGEIFTLADHFRDLGSRHRFIINYTEKMPITNAKEAITLASLIKTGDKMGREARRAIWAACQKARIDIEREEIMCAAIPVVHLSIG
jgi:hypothetical protein